MAKIITPPYWEGYVNAGEERLANFLKANLPDNYLILPNIELSNINPRNNTLQYLEYDFIVIAPHTIYNIENKDFSGRLEGDDNFWYYNDREERTPHKTLRFKTSILVSKLGKKDTRWKTAFHQAQIHSIVTLSYPEQTTGGICGDCENATFLLNKNFLDFLLNTHGLENNHISAFQTDMANFLTAEPLRRTRQQRRNIYEFEIERVLEQDKHYNEYICKTKLGRKKRIKEYSLDVADLNTEELKTRKDQIQNQYLALEKIGNNPYIFKVEFRIDQEKNYFYEIFDYFEENTLRAELKHKTYTIQEKLNIIDNIIKAIKVAHKEQIFHREISPENIFMVNGFAQLGNFGKSYFLDHLDRGFTVMATLNKNNVKPYHAYELLGEDVFFSSDIYSLGVLIYELFVGILPINDPYELSSKGGKLPEDKMPSKINPNLPIWLDELCNKTILEDPDQRIQSIEEMEEFINQKTSESSSPVQLNINVNTNEDPFTIGSTINAYTIYQQIGKGGSSRVFKVKHNIMSKEYAMKVFNESAGSEDILNEYKFLSNIDHSNIVKFIWCDLAEGFFYAITELIKGENLRTYTSGDIKLPIYKIYQVGKQIANALVYIHDKGIIHRDIKPQNIVKDDDERFVLIDFNVSSLAGNRSFVGTNPYIPPDSIYNSTKVNWDSSSDTFALGVTLYELVCKQFPWSGRLPKKDKSPEDPKRYNNNISDSFASFLTKAIQPKKEDRFETASEMLEALKAIENNLLKTVIYEAPVELNNNNDIVKYINSLYSQSKTGNSGTRAKQTKNSLDEITYVSTKLDEKLAPAIIDGMYKLVIITGNAGDGKTAFINNIEKRDEKRKKLDNSNGSYFTLNNIKFQSNYDGSQDEGDKVNEEVLEEFFKIFENIEDFSKPTEGRLIAINEGRLMEFLKTSEMHKNLHDIIDNYFYHEGQTELPKGLLVVNLNLRSVTASSEDKESIFRQQIKKLTKPELWQKCKTCSLSEKCFINYNVSSFNDSVSGNEVIKRFEWLLKTVVLKRELHITIRDLRSFIAFTLTRDYNCNEVKELYGKIDSDILKYWKLFYFNISDQSLKDSGNKDRLVSLIRKTDIGQRPYPSKDRELYFNNHKQKDFLDFIDRSYDILEFFNSEKENHNHNFYNITLEIRENIKEFAKLFARHQYFEGKFELNIEINSDINGESYSLENLGFLKRLPYHSMYKFSSFFSIDKQSETTFNNALNTLKKSISVAISLNEGCNNKTLSEKNLVLSSSQVKDPMGKSFRLFNIEDFELFIHKSENLTTYFEYESDSIIFRHKIQKNISITITLDLYEMLFFIGQGFSPSVNDIKGRFVELEIFKNLLENLTYKEVILTKDDINFYKISITELKGLILEKVESF